MTEAEKRELEALKAKADLTDEEKARLTALEAKAGDGDGNGERTFSESYVKELRNEAASHRKKLRDMEAAMAKYDGINPEEYRKLMDEKEQIEQMKLEKKGDFEAIRQKLVDAHKSELAKEAAKAQAIEAERDALKTELHNTLKAHEVSVAAAVAKAINPRLVEMVAMSKLDIEILENGKRLVRVIDEAGEPRMDLSTGKPYTVQQLMEELRQSEEYAHLFEGGTNGAGSRKGPGSKGQVNPWKKGSINLTQQGQIYRENPVLAEKLKSEAAVFNSAN